MELPLVARVQQDVEVPEVTDLEGAIATQIAPLIEINRHNLLGKRIAITAGSRGIDRIPFILGMVVKLLKDAGASPFLVPTMGSHGGASAAGQEEILKSLGITEDTVGAPIISSLDTIQIGTTTSGVPVWVDKNAAEADGIIVVNRIKPHTEFKGDIESGLLKMMAIGLGKYQGARVVHNHALRQGYARVITEVALTILDKLPVLFGVALIENCYDKVAMVEAISREKIYEREKELLQKARSLMMALPFDHIDILVIDEMGKNISGTGMDTNVIGRVMVYGQKEPETPDIIRIVVLDLTPETHGNATGIGLADFTTKRVIQKLDMHSTVVNCITACTPEKGRLPIALATDREAIEYALQTIGLENPAAARLVHIKNTLHLKVMEVSEALLPEVYNNKNLHLLEKPRPLAFDNEDRLYPVFVSR
ncbi:dimethyladenosine transferase [Moorella thermoacetica Y72]|uniref:Dimethyladenosine transferase n=1 Tax=Moorella thermoacetica Y72 TaxID=1325331 RepID=A0A0S6UCU1_NEOTH|nr:lactate racemase domain-containing protein [Moorella thermoacetica]GAF25321.1 dimethyladenosine transferase [Moorella thermoacetica Y72]